MEHEDIFELMMEALDGELSDENESKLQSHLRACPPCSHEWQTMMAIDTLFRQAPMLSPAADFTQRTIARLPNRRVRLWAMGTIYAVLLLSGLLPILLLVAAALLFFPVFQQPAIVDSAWQLLAKGAQLLGAVAGGLINGLEQLIIEQPALVGWLLVMAGIVFLWNGVYRQLVNQPIRPQKQI